MRTRSRHCTSITGFADGGGRRRAPLPRAVRGARGRARGAPAGRPAAGNLQAWAREVRYRAAGALAGGATWPPATPRPTRSRRSSTGWRPRRAGGRCSGCAPAREPGPAAAVDSRARRPRPTAASAGCGGARTRATPPTRTRATGSAPNWCRRCGGSTRRRRTTCSRWPGSCATRPRCSTSSSMRCSGAGVSVDALRELPAALRRLVVQRLADQAAGGFAPGRPAAPTRSRR